MIWVLIGIAIYLVIGIILVHRAITKDPWGGLLLEYPLLLILIILCYPYFIIRDKLNK